MSLCSVILSLIKILLKKMMLLLQLTTTAYGTKLSWFSFDSKNLFQVIYDLLRSNSGPANHRHLVILQLLLNDDADLKIRIKTWCIGSFHDCLLLFRRRVVVSRSVYFFVSLLLAFPCFVRFSTFFVEYCSTGFPLEFIWILMFLRASWGWP